MCDEYADEIEHLEAIYEQKRSEAQEVNERLAATMQRAIDNRTR